MNEENNFKHTNGIVGLDTTQRIVAYQHVYFSRRQLLCCQWCILVRTENPFKEVELVLTFKGKRTECGQSSVIYNKIRSVNCEKDRVLSQYDKHVTKTGISTP